MRQTLQSTFLSAVFLSVAAVAAAQSGIAGTVRDTSGAVLPGVTVEATSPALIEKVRTVISDGDGAYRILDLRPGAYVVTFTLPGFRTVRRDGVELPPSFTATVDASMAVGTLEEAITVTAEVPLVDVQNVTSQRVMSKELLESLPGSQSPQAFAALQPGVTGQGIAGTPGGREEMGTGAHGASNRESRYLIEGISTGSAHGDGGAGNFFRISQIYVQEMNVTVGGGTVEQPYSGTVTNVIPREGGNRFSGVAYLDYSNDNFAMSNLTPELEAQGFSADSVSKLQRLWDASVGVGGPLLRDTVWFFASYRNSGSTQTRAGLYDNLTPLGWTYTPDLSRPALIKLTDTSRNVRVTWQATQKHKFSAFVDSQPHVVYQRGYQFQISPEATAYAPFPNLLTAVKWTAPLTNRLLVDASVIRNTTDIPQSGQTPDTCLCSAPAVGSDVISALESTTGIMFRAQSNLINQEPLGHSDAASFRYAANVAYVTGSHALKAGMQLLQGRQWFSWEVNGSRAYTLRNGLPIRLTQYASPIRWQNNIYADLGLYIQDQWTLRRLTLTGGIRYDYYNGGAEAMTLGEGPYVPARSFPELRNTPLWRDFSPRLAASYDLFGNARTAVKASIGRYVKATDSSGAIGGPTSAISPNPVVRSVLSTDRNWTDANGDFNPDCDLRNPMANGECGQLSNLNFGQSNPNALIIQSDLLGGLRPHNWETTAVLQHQVARGVSVTAGYYRTSFHNFMVNDNTLVGPSDYSPYCITAPVHPLLPDGGGYQACGLYDINPALFGRNETVVRPASTFGERTQVYDGFDLTTNARLPHRITVSGGVNIGRTKTDNCTVVDSPGDLRFCETDPPFQPNASFMAVVPLPWFGLQTSLTYRDYPGYQITANYRVPNSEIAPSLGRNLASGANGTVDVALIQPGTMYGPRLRQLDLRLSKLMQFGSMRLRGNLDIYNLFNSSTATSAVTTFGPNWQVPSALQFGRYLKVGFRFDF